MNMLPQRQKSLQRGARRSAATFPPSTLLYVSGLVDASAKVEIEVTAFVPAG